MNTDFDVCSWKKNDPVETNSVPGFPGIVKFMRSFDITPHHRQMEMVFKKNSDSLVFFEVKRYQDDI